MMEYVVVQAEERYLGRAVSIAYDGVRCLFGVWKKVQVFHGTSNFTALKRHFQIRICTIITKSKTMKLQLKKKTKTDQNFAAQKGVVCVCAKEPSMLQKCDHSEPPNCALP
jgi:hypothetical protein